MVTGGAPQIRAARVLGRSGFPPACSACEDNTRTTGACPLCGALFCQFCLRRHAPAHDKERYLLTVEEGRAVQAALEVGDVKNPVTLVVMEGEVCRLERDGAVWDRVFEQMVVVGKGPRVRREK